MKSDEQLAASYRESGERQSLDELIERYIGRVRTMVFAMVLDKSLVDDLTQEVFLRVVRGLATFQGRSQFSTWLYRVVMNTVHGFLARRPPVEYRPELPDACPAGDGQPEAAAMRGELAAEIATALGELPPKLRAAVVLVTLDGLDVGEAAHTEGCTRPTMYWRLHEARKRLKKRLASHLSP